MQYPVIEIDLNKIEHNARIICNICKKYGIEVVGVTKVSSGSLEIARAMVNGGVETLGDSKLYNLARYKDLNAKKMLLRLPMISEVKDLVQIAQVSLNSEIKTIETISKEAKKIGKIHEIILMIDVGDLREGIFYEEEIMETVAKTLVLDGVKLTGIGTNLTCYGGVIPSRENLEILVKTKAKINEKFGLDIKVISGGNSSSLSLLQNGNIPKEINQLRLGTSIILGIVEVNWTKILNTYDNAFILKTEIIEIKEKPSKPIGEIAMDAFRNVPSFEDKGIMKRAICAIGRQDCEPQQMKPLDNRISILGSSSDHLILDISKCNDDYKVGDVLTFILDYVAILRGMTSPYVKKHYIKNYMNNKLSLESV